MSPQLHAVEHLLCASRREEDARGKRRFDRYSADMAKAAEHGFAACKVDPFLLLRRPRRGQRLELAPITGVLLDESLEGGVTGLHALEHRLGNSLSRGDLEQSFD